MWAGGDGLMMVLIVALAAWWVRSTDHGPDVGPWLESARRDALGVGSGRDGDDPSDTRGVDDDEEALAAYNRMLARLHAGEP